MPYNIKGLIYFPKSITGVYYIYCEVRKSDVKMYLCVPLDKIPDHTYELNNSEVKASL
jgi:hypothetical protein